MTKIIFTILLSVFITESTPVLAASGELHLLVNGQVEEYVVSGVLRSNEDGIVIKLIQGIQTASSRDEAIGAFSRAVLNQYPGYSLLDTLATPLVIQTKACGQSI